MPGLCKMYLSFLIICAVALDAVSCVENGDPLDNAITSVKTHAPSDSVSLEMPTPKSLECPSGCPDLPERAEDSADANANNSQVVKPEIHFVKVSENGTGFTVDGEDFYIHGFNQHAMMTHAVSDKDFVLEVLVDAEYHGFNTMRTWAFNDGKDQWNSLQPYAGIYDESIFKALDYVLMESRKHGIRVLLALTNHWEEYGGAMQYVNWSKNAEQHNDFYTDPECKLLYKKFAKTLINRRNVYTGIQYKDDEFILGWDLINEARAEGDLNGDKVQGWMEEMASYVKTLDHNHLVTTGSEGFFGKSTPSLHHFNPGEWSLKHGEDFVRNHSPDNIDFAVFHLYPDMWFPNNQCDIDCALDFSREFINAHLTTSLRKPVLLEEVGKKNPGRNRYFETVFELMHNNHLGGGYAVGTLMWQLSPDTFKDVDSFSVYLPQHTSTGSVFVSFATKIASTMSNSIKMGWSFARWFHAGLSRKVNNMSSWLWGNFMRRYHNHPMYTMRAYMHSNKTGP